MKIYLVFCLLFVIAPLTRGATYLAYPSVKYELGRSYDDSRPFDDLTSNGFFSFEKLNTSEVGGSIDFDYFVTDNYQSLISKSGRDFALSAKAKFFGAKAESSLVRETSFSNRKIVLVISAVKKYQAQSVNGTLQLTDRGKQFLQLAESQNKPAAFYRTAGSEVVTGITRQVRLNVVITFETSTAAKASEFKDKLAVSYGSSNAAISLRNSLQGADISYTHKISVYEEGASQANTITNLITNADPLDYRGICAAVAQAFSATMPEKCPIGEVQTMNIRDVPEVAISEKVSEYLELQNVLSRSRDVLLEQLYAAALSCEQNLRAIDEVLVAYQQRPKILTKETHGEVLALQKSFTDQRAQIIKESHRLQATTLASDLILSDQGLLNVASFEAVGYLNSSVIIFSEFRESDFRTINPKVPEHAKFRKAYFPILEVPLPRLLQFVVRVSLRNNGNEILSFNRDEISSMLTPDNRLSFEEVLGSANLGDFSSWHDDLKEGNGTTKMPNRYETANVYSWGGGQVRA